MRRRLTSGQKYLVAGVATALLWVPLVAVAAVESTGLQYSEWRLTVFMVAMTVMLLAVGVSLYWLRENLRLTYGIIEVIAAVAATFASVAQGIDKLGHPSTDPMAYTAPATIIILMQVAGALYIFVRGLDNVSQGLKSWRRGDRAWQWLSLRQIAD